MRGHFLKATFDPSQRLILLVASRQKLEEMTVNAEIGLAINNAIDSRWSLAGWGGKIALNYYKKNQIRILVFTT